jgi:hypothetical protein
MAHRAREHRTTRTSRTSLTVARGDRGAATLSLVRSSIVLAALVAALASREASAQRCPPVPRDFRPRINVYPGDTLLARPELVLGVSLQHQHCTTSRAPAPRIAPSSLRATIIDGPLAGRALSITGAASASPSRSPRSERTPSASRAQRLPRSPRPRCAST